MNRHTTRIVRTSLAICLVLGLADQAKAGIIFSDFGPGDTYLTGTGFSVTGSASSIGSTSSVGAQFTAATGGTLSEIDVAFFAGGDPGASSRLFNLALYSDNGSNQLGSLIELIQNVGPATNQASILAVSSALHPTLVAGNTYWLVASPANTSTYVAWNQNSAGVEGGLYGNFNGTESYRSPRALPTFRLLSAAAVPEPSSLALCGVAVVVGFGLARVHRGWTA